MLNNTSNLCIRFVLSLQATLSEYFELEDDLAQVRSRDPFCAFLH